MDGGAALVTGQAINGLDPAIHPAALLGPLPLLPQAHVL